MDSKIDRAIHNAKIRKKNTEYEIGVLQRMLVTQYAVIEDLEKIQAQSVYIKTSDQGYIIVDGVYVHLKSGKEIVGRELELIKELKL